MTTERHQEAKRKSMFCSGHSVQVGQNDHFLWVKLSSLIYLPIRLVIVVAHTT